MTNKVEEAIESVNAELIESFKGLDQRELLTRKEVLAIKADPSKANKKRRRIQMIAKRKSLSQLRGHNLNGRVGAADRLWKRAWMHERGAILRHVGVTWEEEITALANCKECPEIVLQFFLKRGKL